MDALTTYVTYLFFRSAGMLFRFGIPIFLLYQNEPSLLGEYYLISSIIAGYSVLGGAELAMYYTVEGAKRYQSRVLLLLLIKRLAMVNLVLLVPSTALLSVWINNLDVAILVALSLAIEAISYETGRFYWNIGRHELISVRDFLRPAIFSLGVFISIYLEGLIIAKSGVVFFLIANLLHLSSELLYILKSEKGVEGVLKNKTKPKIKISYRNYISTVGPHFFQNQLLAYSLVAERSLLLTWAGASFLGFYSMWFSITSAIAQLVSFPWLVNLKAEILQWQTATPPAYVFLNCLKVLPILLVSSAFGLFGAFVISIYASSVNVMLPQLGLFAFFVILISSTSYAYSAIVAALYSHASRFLSSQLWTAFSFLPIYAAAVGGLIFDVHDTGMLIGLVSIGLSSLLLLFTRIAYFLKSKDELI